MRSFRFLHTADLHLGTPFHGLRSRTPETVMAKLRAAAYQVFSRIVDIAVAEQVDFLIIAGDLFDARDVPMAALFELHRGFERLKTAGVRVFVCHGNHDPLTAPRGIDWPENVTVFPAAPKLLTESYRVPSMYFDLDAETRIQVSGFSYGQSEMTQSPAKHYVRDARAVYAIALYHGVVGSPGQHANYCATTENQLVQANFDYWALGHIHQGGVVRANRPTIVYPGNPQGRHIQEQGRRFCVIVDVDFEGSTTMRQLATSTVVWHSCEVDLAGATDFVDVRARVLNAVHAVADANDDAFVLLRLTLHGQTPLHAQLMETDEWCDVLNEDLQHQRMPVWIESLRRDTAPVVDVDALSHSAEYVGEFLRLVHHYQRDIAEARRDLLPALRDVFHRANDLSVEELSDDEVRDLLELAERLALKYVGEQVDAS